VFVEINSVNENLPQRPSSADAKLIQRYRAVAEILGQLVDRNGAILPLAPPFMQVTPLTVLKEMVRNGKGVVALVGGAKSVPAVMAAYKAGLFNYLVTDESCAEMLLKAQHPEWRVSALPYRDEWWERKQHFYVAFLRYGQPTSYCTIKDIAHRLALTPKRVRGFLNNLHKGGSHEPMITIRVRAPSSEMELEMYLIRLLRLSEARVVAAGENGFYELGRAAAQLFWELVRGQPNFSVGIGSGQAIKAMMTSLKLSTTLQKFPHIKSLTFWALNTNPFPKVFGIFAETILASVAVEWFNSEGNPIVQFHTLRQEQNPKLDAVFVELDAFEVFETNAQTSQGLSTSLSNLDRRPIGEILLQFFTDNGSIIPVSSMPKSVAPFSLSELKRMVQEGKPVIVIAQGKDKATALLAAYKAGLFNALVVDCSLAEEILERA